MPAAAVKAIDVLRVKEIRPSDCFGQGFFRPRHNDQVNVIGHQTIAEDPQAVPGGLPRQDREIGLVIIINEERVLAIVPPLGDMMRNVGQDDSGDSWHGGMLTDGRWRVKK